MGRNLPKRFKLESTKQLPPPKTPRTSKSCVCVCVFNAHTCAHVAGRRDVVPPQYYAGTPRRRGQRRRLLQQAAHAPRGHRRRARRPAHSALHRHRNSLLHQMEKVTKISLLSLRTRGTKTHPLPEQLLPPCVAVHKGVFPDIVSTIEGFRPGLSSNLQCWIL